ncbi:MAG: PKD domain protein [Candidatus Omnitrophica bacterium ADurb.Bin205]|nr:MAG: PKD domain protein [Candidatus Omnitrophica bacterium ADurb.Bin205]
MGFVGARIFLHILFIKLLYLKMERKYLILVSVVVTSSILFFPVIILAGNTGYEAASEFLGEYGIAQYNDGLTADAVHELRKCLIADKYNENCSRKLKEIFAGPFKLASPTVVCRNEKIIFDASNSYGKLLNNPTCLWDFGDGTSFQGLKTSKSYSKAGVYTVKFYARDSISGPFSEHNKVIKIVVYGPSEVDAGSDIDICCNKKSDYEVNFLADPNKTDTGGLSYFWDFGDGSTDKGRSTKHIYKQAGEFIVMEGG